MTRRVATTVTVTEAAWQETVVHYAHLRGWRVAHFRPARTTSGWRTPVAVDGVGFPDLVLARPGYAPVFLELKSDRGRVTPAQHEWIDALGDQARVARPRDWDQIRELLA